MECLPYRAEFQSELEEFLLGPFKEIGEDLDLTGRHADLRRIPEFYQKTGDFWVLRDQGKIIGTIALRWIEDRTGEIKRFFVAPGKRGKGQGKTLLEKVIQSAPTFGFRKLRLDTNSKSPAANHLFKKYGFRLIPRYNDEPSAEYFFELTLV
ncbi:MAG TPA: GNAT family N-acetyltransferase [bacterium]|nr:GNAT family N-acetyltransferase [bacterium]